MNDEKNLDILINSIIYGVDPEIDINSESIKKLLNNQLERLLIAGYSISISKSNENSFVGNLSKLDIITLGPSSETVVEQMCHAASGKSINDVLFHLESEISNDDKSTSYDNSIIDELLGENHLTICRIGVDFVAALITDLDSKKVIYSGIGENILDAIKTLEENCVLSKKTYADEDNVTNEKTQKLKKY